MQFSCMRIFLKIFFSLFFITATYAVVVRYYRSPAGFKHTQSSNRRMPGKTPLEPDRLRLTVASLKKFIQKNHFNDKICFLADMDLPSGMNRFFVYDINKDSVLLSGLVAHGSCDDGFQASPGFSNKVNSGCTCIGKFRIGSSYNGKFGLAYKLYGLDSSNDQAFERNIVLHAYKCVPERETYPLPICNSRGCPMVSPGFLEKLRVYIDRSDRPVLLTIFR